MKQLWKSLPEGRCEALPGVDGRAVYELCSFNMQLVFDTAIETLPISKRGSGRGLNTISQF